MKPTSIFALGALLCTVSAMPSLDATKRSTKRLKTIPGPGFPSLAELGITEADLDGNQFSEAPDQIYVQGDTEPVCSGGDDCSVRGVDRCINYLQFLNQNCTVGTKSGSGVEIETCESGDAKVYIGLMHGGNATTPCKTIARYSRGIRKTCKEGRRLYGFQYIDKADYTSKHFRKDNVSFFVEIMSYNSSEPSPSSSR